MFCARPPKFSILIWMAANLISQRLKLFFELPTPAHTLGNFYDLTFSIITQARKHHKIIKMQ